MATILVTGDTGFIGSSLVRELLNDDHRVIGVSRSTHVDEDLLKTKDYRHITSDVATLKAKVISEPIDVFIDLAWSGSMGPERGDKVLQNKNVENAIGNVDLASALNAKLYLGVGTITELTALAPDAPEGPATTYGLSKNLAHQETKKRAQDLELEHIWIRLGNTYSEYDTSGRFLNSTLSKLARHEPVKLMTGNQPFDFIHLSDTVLAIIEVAIAGENGEVYYVGNGDVATIEDFVSVAANILNSHSEIESKYVTKLGLTEDDLVNDGIVSIGYQQQVSFIEGVRRWKAANVS